MQTDMKREILSEQQHGKNRTEALRTKLIHRLSRLKHFDISHDLNVISNDLYVDDTAH